MYFLAVKIRPWQLAANRFQRDYPVAADFALVCPANLLL